jgi:uncharacterized membrane protein
MIPDPLHPAVVHLPMALAVLMPLLALLGVIALRRGFLPARAWLVVVLLQALLLGSGWVALETGEREEERVEKAVAESRIEAHEEQAERFMVAAAVGFLVSAAGLIAGSAGALARVASVLVSAGVLAAGIAVGHSGGELVYRYGAASAYVQPREPVAQLGEPGSSPAPAERDDDD